MKAEILQRFSIGIAAVLIAATGVLVGCGGGGGGTSNGSPNNSPQSPLSTAMLKGSLGFVNASGFTVYVFDADLASPGHSVCNGSCAGVWPPIAPPTTALTSPWSMIARADSSLQLTYNGRPLYMYTGDAAAGQTNGDGISAFGGIWHIARPLGSGASPGPSPTSMPSGY
jgi:predicted lipoprotein with Yx(FWY)xxD motif